MAVVVVVVVDVVVCGVGVVIVVGVVELFNSNKIIVVGYCYRVPPLKLECRYQFFNFNSFLAHIL